VRGHREVCGHAAGAGSRESRDTIRMRILFYNHTGIVSGAEKMLLLTLRHLPRDLYDLMVVCPEEGSLLAEASSLGVPSFPVPPIQARFTYNPVALAGYLVSTGRAFGKLRRSFKSLAPDILHANTVRAGIMATIATLGRGIPVIWHTHDILPRHPLTILIRFLAQSSSRIQLVACSEAAARSMRLTICSRVPVTVIHNGVDTVKFRSSPTARAAKREELGLGSSVLAIGIVGQVTRRKGQLGLIRAFAEVHRTIPDAVLMVVGSPMFNKDREYFRELEQEVHSLHLEEKVRFLGQRADIPALMHSFDVVVLNSDVEPFALVLAEAMMAGKAVIATDSGGVPEIVRDGRNGELVKVGDQQALAAALIRLARDPSRREQFGREATRTIQTTFTKEQYIAKWRGLYDRTKWAKLAAQPLHDAQPEICK
jgi:glycosyltransferase involved in cell wall biosynthesis